MSDLQIEQTLWQRLASRGAVQGDRPASLRTPWPIRLLMGGAGWLGALFFQVFLIGTVFAATRGNGPAMAVTGAVMIGAAAVVYRTKARESARIALGQFALALSLGGQGMLVVGVAETLGYRELFGTASLWLGVAALEVLLFAVVPDRLHRFLSGLGVWLALALAGCIALGDMVAPRWTAMPPMIGLLGALALAGAVAFVSGEERVAASGRHAPWEPAADASLVFALGGMLVVTGAIHPASIIFGTGRTWYAPGAWLAGALSGGVLVAFALAECKRLACDTRTSATMLVTAIAFSALMVYAPAVTAGVVALMLALRRGALTWMGLAIATMLVGFVWYYSTLQWTLLAKSATLAGAGGLLLGVRAVAMRLPRAEVSR
ncbi:DUF4401 domain-containing protein [Cupriavidus agavae]|uniref:Uncharacterized protein DUF4401 n=1 Tax=Cupriavidus agavae TaxID=1001822 RepID=A0A4Q7RKK0_9BURK|nr:DUF4401 domain-containing protein [Cupriavidus agavae]RZT32382.1 uncharacterized protein DUF4401 [Cupriavidus agavae]